MAKLRVSRVFFSNPLQQGKKFSAPSRHPKGTSQEIFGCPKNFRLGVAQPIFLIFCVHFLLHGGSVSNFFNVFGQLSGLQTQFAGRRIKWSFRKTGYAPYRTTLENRCRDKTQQKCPHFKQNFKKSWFSVLEK